MARSMADSDARRSSDTARMRARRRRAAVVVASFAGVGLLSPAPSAEASRIWYGCGYNLCRVDADGSGRRQITVDGRSSSYYLGAPSVSRDGSRLAFVHDTRLYVGDGNARRRRRVPLPYASFSGEPEIRPDGREVLWPQTGSNELR